MNILVSENQAPTARNDLLTAPGWDAAATSPPWGRIQPIRNDVDPDNDRLAISGRGASRRMERTVEVLFRPHVWWCEYLPQPGNTEPDSFTYTINDLNGGTSTATISVNVTPNRAPRAFPDVVMAHGSATQSLDLLTNDTDPDERPAVGDLQHCDPTRTGVGRVQRQRLHLHAARRLRRAVSTSHRSVRLHRRRRPRWPVDIPGVDQPGQKPAADRAGRPGDVTLRRPRRSLGARQRCRPRR